MAPARSARPPRWEVENIDQDDVSIIDVEGSRVEVQTAYVFKFAVSNENVAEQVARRLLAQKHLGITTHRLDVNVRQIYRGPKR